MVCLVAGALLCAGVRPARAAAAREYLDQARAASTEIQLAGDQSAALQAIALTLATVDPYAALETVARIRRPSDATRALGAAAVGIAPNDPVLAAENVITAGRLLMRIADQDQRVAEQRLLLREIAALGEDALPAGPELTTGQAQLAVILGRAESDPAGALALLRKWELTGPPAGEAAAAIAVGMAREDPDQALEVGSGIVSARRRDRALWRIAEQRPPEEAVAIAPRVSDPITRAAMLTSAAVRTAGKDPERALAVARTVEVARDSALAEVAAAVAAEDAAGALETARGLPDRSRLWALERIAVEIAGKSPALAEQLLAEAGAGSEAVRGALVGMVRTDPGRAVGIARSLRPGEDRDGALAGLAGALAGSDPGLAEELLWEIESPRWRGEAVEPVALALAGSDLDAATGLIGLVTDADRAGRIRAKMAVVVAARDPEAAARVLESLPPGDYRSDAALSAAKAVLSAGGQPETAERLGAIGVEPDLALRWALPYLAFAQTRSLVGLSERIKGAYPRALALVDIAREMLRLDRKAQAAPDRARQIRRIVEWEGR
ncbi:MAG TPA: hypothetical protein VMY87_02105 [Armatimonadota bacterium]|nr:hypothetical protein [Armatimonadota bacterium]